MKSYSLGQPTSRCCFGVTWSLWRRDGDVRPLSSVTSPDRRSVLIAVLFRPRADSSFAPASVPQRPRRRGGGVRPGVDVEHGERAGRSSEDHLPVGALDLGRPERRDQHQHHGAPRHPAQQRRLLRLLQLGGGEEHQSGPR